MHNLTPVIREQWDKPKVKDIVQNNWSVLFKSVKVMIDKERLKDYHRMEEKQEQITKCNPG